MLEVRDLTKRYGDVLAIDRVSFKAEKGEILGFLGPNGAGKTTTMRILTGYLPPSSGAATVAGFDVVKDSMEVRRRLGYLPEQPPVYEDMTVGGYLEFAAKLKQIWGKKRREAVDRAIDQTSVGDMRRRLIRTLSKGYKQRVGLAQALLGEPEVLILDEPTVGLDPVQIREIRDLIRSFAGNHTVILSTHILPEVQMTCSRVVIIHRGRIVAADDLKHLYEHAAGEQTLRVRVIDAAAREIPDALASVSGVLDVQREGQSFVLRITPAEATRAGVAAEIARGGWGLLEMTPLQTTLEDIFIRYMASEDPGAAR